MPLKTLSLLILFSLSLLPACSQEEKNPPDIAAADKALVRKAKPASTSAHNGCTACHSLTIDKNHDIGCDQCHEGNKSATDIIHAHAGLVAQPAQPGNLDVYCGKCHELITSHITASKHFTLGDEINLVRQNFGAEDTLSSPIDIPKINIPKTILELSDDLLRRRCLRCHVYNHGDPYEQTSHNTGCAACHLDFKNHSHVFLDKPGDRQCQQCHYGNFVGADFHGDFEHDFNNEYRTPYGADGEYPDRPYGVESHRLSADIHQQAGFICIDCHSGRELMNIGGSAVIRKITCQACHELDDRMKLPENIVMDKQNPVLTLTSGRKITIPQATDLAHLIYGKKADCVVCHAQWTFTDKGTNLLRDDTDNFDPWEDLMVQGSLEIEAILSNVFYGDEEGPAQMSDQLAGVMRPGIWYKGYETRRWETPLIGADKNGRLHVMRPILDLHLSYVNSAGKVVFDAEKGAGSGLRPYTPHTIGKAGIFYRQRLVDNTDQYRRKVQRREAAQFPYQ